MADHTFTTLVPGGSFYEGPRWHDGRWWASDIYGHTVWSVTPEGHREAVLTVDGQPSGLGWLADGSLLATSMRTREVLRRDPAGTVSVHADLSGLCPGYVNDMVVDAAGRAYVGNFGYPPDSRPRRAPTVLVKVDPDGTAGVVADDLLFPNGALVTPDGRTLIVAESTAGRLSAFTVGADGTLTDRRVWAQLGTRDDPGPTGPVAPDGICVDLDGHVWVADAAGRRCLLVAQGGRIVEQLDAPDGLAVYACALGGPDGRTLLLCAAPGFAEHERAGADDAVLLTTRVEVGGAVAGAG